MPTEATLHLVLRLRGPGEAYPRTTFSAIGITGFSPDGYGGFLLSLDASLSYGSTTSLSNDFNNTIKVASRPSPVAFQHIASINDVTDSIQTKATNANITVSTVDGGTTNINVVLSLPAPSGDAAFFKAFALEQLPAGDENGRLEGLIAYAEEQQDWEELERLKEQLRKLMEKM